MSLHSIMNNIRSTSLNYAIQETPFSIFVTVRNSLNTSKIPRTPTPTSDYLDSDVEQVSRLVARCNFLEQANESLKTKYEDEVIENENKTKCIIGL